MNDKRSPIHEVFFPYGRSMSLALLAVDVDAERPVEREYGRITICPSDFKAVSARRMVNRRVFEWAENDGPRLLVVRFHFFNLSGGGRPVHTGVVEPKWIDTGVTPQFLPGDLEATCTD